MRSMNSPDPIQFIQNAPFLALLYEQNTWFKLIPIDGRPHAKGLDPTWFGDSVGHWEGDTLVVHTNNFNGKTRLDTIGHPHSDALEITERFTRPDLGHMSYEVTIHDPKAFTEDWGNKRTFTLRTDTQIMEYSCEENNKSLWEGRIKVPQVRSVEIVDFCFRISALTAAGIRAASGTNYARIWRRPLLPPDPLPAWTIQRFAPAQYPCACLAGHPQVSRILPPIRWPLRAAAFGTNRGPRRAVHPWLRHSG